MIDTNEKCALVVLAYDDYKVLEISLANHAKTLLEDPNSNNIDIYIVLNAKPVPSFGSSMVEKVAKRYESLYPQRVFVIDWCLWNNPYYSILELLISPQMEQYKYICKIDDDAFCLNNNWLNTLQQQYKEISLTDKDLAVVTPLVNNNPYGFKFLMENTQLGTEYFETLARDHVVPEIQHLDIDCNCQLVSKNQIKDGNRGTIWKLPHIARWLHEKTSLLPENYLSLIQNFSKPYLLDPNRRLSINIIFFERDFWKNCFEEINPEQISDEVAVFKYIKNNQKHVYSINNLAGVHIAFFVQRDEILDLMPKFLQTSTNFCHLPWTLDLVKNHDDIISMHLKYIEKERKEIIKKTHLNIFNKKKERKQFDLLCEEYVKTNDCNVKKKIIEKFIYEQKKYPHQVHIDQYKLFSQRFSK